MELKSLYKRGRKRPKKICWEFLGRSIEYNGFIEEMAIEKDD